MAPDITPAAGAAPAATALQLTVEVDAARAALQALDNVLAGLSAQANREAIVTGDYTPIQRIQGLYALRGAITAALFARRIESVDAPPAPSAPPVAGSEAVG